MQTSSEDCSGCRPEAFGGGKTSWSVGKRTTPSCVSVTTPFYNFTPDGHILFSLSCSGGPLSRAGDTINGLSVEIDRSDRSQSGAFLTVVTCWRERLILPVKSGS